MWKAVMQKQRLQYLLPVSEEFLFQHLSSRFLFLNLLNMPGSFCVFVSFIVSMTFNRLLFQILNILHELYTRTGLFFE